jgi:thiosulfate reductase cytochrome b subunit
MTEAASPSPGSGTQHVASEIVYRHTRIVRIAHWINALCFLLLLMSGLQIFNAHPALYWGQSGNSHDVPLLRINGGFPGWLTLPSYHDLATGRNWHFFLAWALVINGLTYIGFSIANRHFQRDILPRKNELKPKHLWEEVVHHARFKRITGPAAKRYNTLQKLAYVAVVFVLFPLIVLTGLTMSPGFNAIAPFLLDVFGGRQSARTLHFIAANLLVLFLVIHLVEVVVAGAWNEIRSMITGKYVVPPGPALAEDVQ